MASRSATGSSGVQYKLLEPVVNVHDAKVVTADNIYWKSYEFPTIVQEFGAVSHIDIRPTHPYDIAVSAATRVQIYCSETNERIKTFTRFHDTVYSGSYRSDGNLIVAGNEDAKIRLFDNEGRVPLRIFKGHTRPVHVTRFCNNLKHIFSAGDDKIVNIWDVATEQVITSYSEHQDYIRAGVTCKSSADIIATGSYDHTSKLYDARTKSSILSVDHGQPIESILVHPSGSLVFTAGGNVIKVWDVLQGGKLLTAFSHHHKTITCLAFNHNQSRILSGSLDRHVKIYDLSTYEVIHNMNYPGAILSLAVSNEDKTLAVGMADKILSLKKRKAKLTDKVDNRRNNRKSRQESNYYVRGRDYAPNKDDIVIYHLQKEELPKYEKYFLKFHHSKALDAALGIGVKPEITVGVLKELIRRSNLNQALAGRNSTKLLPVLKFITRFITKTSFTPVLTHVANALVDLYSPEIQEHTKPAQMLFVKLREKVKLEVKLHTEMYSLLGCVDALMATHAKSKLNRDTKSLPN